MKKLTLRKLFKNRKLFASMLPDEIRRFVIKELLLTFHEVQKVRQDNKLTAIEIVGLSDNAVKLARIAFNADKLKEAFVHPVDTGAVYGVDDLRDDINAIMPKLKKEGIVFIPSTEDEDIKGQIVAVVELVHALISLIKSFK